MDIHTTDGEHYAGGIPKAPDRWEAHIRNEQGLAHGHSKSSLGKRRKTVHGIPSFGDFVRQHDERERGRRAHDGRRRSNYPTEPKDSHVFPFDGSLAEDLHEKYPAHAHSNSPGSFSFQSRLSPRTARNSHHSPSSRHSRHRTSSTRRSTPDPTAPDSSPTAFEERVKKDKARFSSSQAKRPHLRSNLSATVFANFGPPLPQAEVPRASTREQIHILSQASYHAWREACDAQLKDKTAMTHVPNPPVQTCSECVTASIIAGQTPPIACEHSLRKMIRTGIAEAPNSAAFRRAYLAILKSERQRWHTDRFGAVPSRVRPQVMRSAQQLFIIANKLYEAAKLQNEDASAPLDDMIPRTTPNRPSNASHYNKWFKGDDVHAW